MVKKASIDELAADEELKRHKIEELRLENQRLKNIISKRNGAFLILLITRRRALNEYEW